MAANQKLRQGLSMIMLLGMINGPVNVYAQLIPASAVASGFIADEATEQVATFRLTEKLEVGLDSRFSQRITLQPGDVIDVGLEMPKDANDASVKAALAKDASGFIVMKVEDASNQAFEDRVIYLKPQMLQFAALVNDKSGDLGQTELDMPDDVDVNVGIENKNSFGLPTDQTDIDNMQEMPDFQVKFDSKGAPAPLKPAAKPRGNVPLLKPGMPNLLGTINSTFASYSKSTSVNRLVRAAQTHLYTVDRRGHKIPRYIVNGRMKRGHRWVRVHQTYCWRAVKDALKASGMVNSSFGEGSPNAFQARDLLMRQGFRDLLADPRTASVMRNPNNAPVGAILVYKVVARKRILANNSNPGHVEIKDAPAGQPGFISISQSSAADYGGVAKGKRTLVGVMVRD